MVSIRLPRPAELERRCQSLAMLDAILCRDWELRMYSFNKDWGGGRMASMRDGSGDEVFILFTPRGAAIKGFAHELTSGSGGDHFAGFPSRLTGFLDEPAFSISDTTFCLWSVAGGPWLAAAGLGQRDDGSADLLRLYQEDASAITYCAYARDYFEVAVSEESAAQIYAHSRLSEGLVRSLNGDLTLADLEADADEIGYPR